MAATKFLRLDSVEVEVLVTLFGSLRLSAIPDDQRPAVLELRDRLGRFSVASAEELREDHEVRGRRGKHER